MNQKTFNFNHQTLVVDYIKVKINEMSEHRLVYYFFKRGFNCFKSSTKSKHHSKQTLKTDDKNDFEVMTKVDDLYESGIF